MNTILGAIAGLQMILVAIVGPVLDFVDRRQVVRRAIVIIVLWQLVDAYLWGKAYAMREGMTGVELSAVLLAITGPVTILQGFLFRMYDTSRRADGAAE